MTPIEIVHEMLRADAYSNWLGLEVLQVGKGSCLLKCIVKEEMLNGFKIAHGGITYALSDSALAFAANAHGLKCVSIETSITHLKPVLVNDELTIECIEINRTRSFGVYKVKIRNQKEQMVSSFTGTVNISQDSW